MGHDPGPAGSGGREPLADLVTGVGQPGPGPATLTLRGKCIPPIQFSRLVGPGRLAWDSRLGAALVRAVYGHAQLRRTDVDAGTAAMLVKIGPVLLALLGGWLLHEGFPRRPAAGMANSFGGVLVVGISESDGDRTSVIGVVLCLAAAVCYAAGVVCQKLALRHASPVQVTTFGCFTGTAACLPFAGQLLSQLGAPYNPRGHNLRRSRPSRHGDQRARRLTTGTVDLVREDY